MSRCNLRQCPHCFAYYHLSDCCPHGCPSPELPAAPPLLSPIAQPPKLLPQHLADLRKSGLSDETIAAAGICSITDAQQIRKILGWDAGRIIGSCMAIPFRRADGSRTGYVRLRPDKPRERNGKKVKYESPIGRGNHAYFAVRSPDVLRDPSYPLLISEGEKKALKAKQEGFDCIGLVGVYGFQKARPDKSKPRELIDDLAPSSIVWKGRTVYICYDSDLAEKVEVRWAEWHLAETLMRHGANVRVVRLPSGPNGEKVGLDDYLVSHSAADLQKLLDVAQPARKPEADTPPPSTWIAELEEMLRQRKQLPRRDPDLRKPHQRCHNLQTGLFGRRHVAGDTNDIALTHSCAKPSRCEPCASFDRDRRYGDYLYAVATCEPAGSQLYYYTTNSEQEWRNFTAQQRRAAKSDGELARRFQAFEDAPDGSTIRRVITPILHRDAKPISREEANEIARKLCDDLHTRGARRVTARCWGAWRQERPEPKYERLCRSIPDTAEIEEFLRSVGVSYEVSLSPRGAIYRRLQLHYTNEAQRDAVREWFHQRDRQRRMSQSAVFPTDCDTKERWRRYLERFDDDFRPDDEPRRRRTG